MRPIVTPLFLLALPAAAAAQDWTKQFPETPPDLKAVDTLDGNVVWAVGNGGLVTLSTDGGTTWTDTFVASGRLTDVVFADAAFGLAAGDGIFRTTDGGATWDRVHPTTRVTRLDVLDASRAWAVTEDAYVLRTVDGGTTWHVTVVPGWFAGRMHSIDFVDQDRGWLVGDHGQLFRSTDGGATWTAGNSPSNDPLYDVHREDPSSLWLLEDDGVWRTDNGGANWNFELLGWTAAAQDLDVVNGTRAYSTGLFGRIFRTNDAGGTWLLMHTHPGELEDLAFATRRIGFTCGEDGIVLRTDDGAQTWTTVRGGTPSDDPWIRGLAIAGNNVVYAACTDGVILRSDDGGDTWWAQDGGSSNTHFRDVSFADPVHGYAVAERQGFYPTICYTHDGGLNWVERNELGMYDYHTAEALSGDVAIVTGDTWVKRTTDGGLSWTSITPSPLGTYYGSDFVDSQRGWIVGTKTFRTDDGGQTWTFLDDPTETYEDVSFATADVGWIAGRNGALARSTDGGVTWTPQSTGASGVNYYAVEALSSQIAWVAGSGGYVAFTSDGGQTWSEAAPAGLSTDTVRAMAFANLNDGWIGGDGDAGIWKRGATNGTCEVANYCQAKVNSLGQVAELDVLGAPNVDNGAVGVAVTNCIPGSVSIGIWSETGPANTPWFGGTLCVEGPLFRLPLQTIDGAGFTYWIIPMDSTMAGTTRWFQAWYRDVNAPDGTGVGITDGLRLSFCQ